VTPKEIAYAAFVGDQEYNTLIKNIEQAIKDAVEEVMTGHAECRLNVMEAIADEREACAKLADKVGNGLASHADHYIALDIADGIRGRK